MFVFCRICAENFNNRIFCNYRDEERVFVGIWTIVEFYVVFRRGYVLRKIYWVSDYRSRSDKLFDNFVKIFFKRKIKVFGYF